MLFHVMAQHYWDTCDGARRAKGDPDVKPRTESQRWVEGNDKVKVLSATGHQTLHRLFAVVEAGEYADVQGLFTDQKWNDMGAQRKDWGEWGKEPLIAN